MDCFASYEGNFPLRLNVYDHGVVFSDYAALRQQPHRHFLMVV